MKNKTVQKYQLNYEYMNSFCSGFVHRKNETIKIFRYTANKSMCMPNAQVQILQIAFTFFVHSFNIFYITKKIIFLVRFFGTLIFFWKAENVFNNRSSIPLTFPYVNDKNYTQTPSSLPNQTLTSTLLACISINAHLLDYSALNPPPPAKTPRYCFKRAKNHDY